jgi:hypothetical protein
MLAVEIVRAAWRLHRRAVAEPEDGVNPATQASDRGRASAHNSLRRLLNDLRQFQSDRWLRAEVLCEGFDRLTSVLPKLTVSSKAQLPTSA